MGGIKYSYDRRKISTNLWNQLIFSYANYLELTGIKYNFQRFFLYLSIGKTRSYDIPIQIAFNQKANKFTSFEMLWWFTVSAYHIQRPILHVD